GKPTYDSIDVGQYLLDHAQGQRGLFLLHVRRASGRLPPTAGRDEGDDEGEPDARALDDARLIVVTNLGFFVKRAKDGSRDVFVQSISTGLPVAGARVSLIGTNGQPVQSSVTDLNGRAQLPAPGRDLVRE